MSSETQSAESDYQLSRKGKVFSSGTIGTKKTVTTVDSQRKLHPLRDVNFYERPSDRFDSSSDEEVSKLSKEI